jgi:hypothetical protein
MSYADRSLLRSYLAPDIQEGADQGWEETVNAAVMYLLKTSLAKNVKDTSSSLSGTTLEVYIYICMCVCVCMYVCVCVCMCVSVCACVYVCFFVVQSY